VENINSEAGRADSCSHAKRKETNQSSPPFLLFLLPQQLNNSINQHLIRAKMRGKPKGLKAALTVTFWVKSLNTDYGKQFV